MDPRIIDLIQKLEFKTQNKEAIWARTSGDNEFKIEINNATITTDSWNANGNGVLCYDFVILNENGETIERFSVNEEEAYSQEYIIISKLYNTVKNSYYKVDETIDNIIAELNTSSKIGGHKKI